MHAPFIHAGKTDIECRTEFSVDRCVHNTKRDRINLLLLYPLFAACRIVAIGPEFGVYVFEYSHLRLRLHF
jgi:hypothetical protein